MRCALSARSLKCAASETSIPIGRGTDTPRMPGIFYEIFEARIGRLPTPAELSRFHQHFMNLLAAAAKERPFSAVPGAARLLSLLADHRSHVISLATGCWSDSARLKMASAGMCYDAYPAASCDDALERDSIIKLSMQKAAIQFGGPRCPRSMWVMECGMRGPAARSVSPSSASVLAPVQRN